MKDPTKYEKITTLFILFAILFIGVFDGYVIFKGGTGASISHWIITKSYNFPIIPFIAGFICGHLFWRMRDTSSTNNIGK